jgi:uncharacterized coiled-coil DUF342 family protein
MILEWIVIGGIVIAMYIIIYKYEKKMNKMQELIDENKERIGKNHEGINQNRGKLDEHHEKITSNHERSKSNRKKLEEHHNYIEEMWVTIPKRPNTKEDTP